MIALLATLSAWADGQEELAPVQATPTELRPPSGAPAAVDPLATELLGTASGGPPAETLPPSGSPSALLAAALGLWPLAIAGAGAALVYAATRRKAAGGSDLLRVVGKTPVGTNHSGLVLVDVRDPGGHRRRLLIGTAGSGVPNLVADLGEDDGIDTETPAPQRVAQPAPTLTAPIVAPKPAQQPRRPAGRPTVQLDREEDPPSMRRNRQLTPTPVEQEEDPPSVRRNRAFAPSANQKAQARALIAEVVQSRTANGR
ncbi:MAG: flagellar biosynthetic protein FliO [Myxococcota bacterium]